MEQEHLSERSKPRAGRQAKNLRKQEIFNLISIVRGNRNWRDEFLKEYPEFDNKDGLNLLTYATRGTASAPELLEALRVWIPKIQKDQPEWFVKQLAIVVP